MPINRMYLGLRQADGCVVNVLLDQNVYALPTRPRPGRTYASGWEWGYGGTGPAQLAWDLAVSLFGFGEAAWDATHLLLHQFVARLTGDTWTKSEAELRALCADVVVEITPDPPFQGEEGDAHE